VDTTQNYWNKTVAANIWSASFWGHPV